MDGLAFAGSHHAVYIAHETLETRRPQSDSVRGYAQRDYSIALQIVGYRNLCRGVILHD